MGHGAAGWWMAMSQPPAGDDDVAMKGDDPCRFRQVQRMGERVPSASRHTRTVPPPLAITGLPSRSTPTAIALATSISVFQRQHRGKVEAAALKDLPV